MSRSHVMDLITSHSLKVALIQRLEHMPSIKVWVQVQSPVAGQNTDGDSDGSDGRPFVCKDSRRRFFFWGEISLRPYLLFPKSRMRFFNGK